MRFFTPIFIIVCSLLTFLTQDTIASSSEGYVLGPGDILTFTIFAGGKTQEQLEVTVSNQGKVNLPFIGSSKASGLSVAGFAERVRRLLAKDYFVDPQVIVSVKEYKSRQVYVTGAVVKPGIYNLEKSITLLELIARAGGVTQDRGNHAYIMHGSLENALGNNEINKLIEKGGSTSINLKDLLDKGISKNNIEIQPGDVVYIQPAFFSDTTQHKVYVLGKVKNPGAYDYQDGLSALNACALAGGFDKYAAPNRTVITRKNTDGKVETVKLDLEKVQEGDAVDLQLHPGDRIFVPESWL